MAEQLLVDHLVHLVEVRVAVEQIDGDRIPPFLFAEKQSPRGSEQKPTTDPSSLLKTYQAAAIARARIWCSE